MTQSQPMIRAAALDSTDERGDGVDVNPIGERTLLALLFGFALVVRVVAVFRTAVIFNDGPTFLELAAAMQAGHWREALTHAYHPLYPLLVSFVEPATGSFEAAAITLSVLGGSLAVVALYLFLRQAYDRSVATVGAALFAVHPYAIRFSADVQSDSVYLAFFLAAVAALYHALSRGSVSWAAATGLLSGFAYLTRPEGVGVLVVGVGIAFVSWLRGRWAIRQTIAWTTACVAGFAVLALPYLTAIRVTSGAWSFSQKKSVWNLMGVEPASAQAALGDGIDGWPVWALAAVVLAGIVAAYISPRLLGSIRGRAAGVRIGSDLLAGLACLTLVLVALAAPAQVEVFAANVISTLRPEYAFLLVIGIATRVRSGPQGRSLFVSALLGLYAIVLFGLLLHYGYLSRRHSLPPLTLVMGYVALGLIALAEALRGLPLRFKAADDEGVRAWSRAAVLALLLVGAAVGGFTKAWSDYRGEELAGRLAAEWLSGQPDADGRLAANRRKLGYYAGREWRALRVAEGPRPLAALQAEGVRYVILEQELLDARFAPLAPYAAAGAPALSERHRVEARGRNAVVFELE